MNTIKAIEVAARAVYPFWDKLNDIAQKNILGDMQTALEAAKPFMYAQAWRDMANQLDYRDRRDGQVWLHAVIEEIRYRADDLEANPWPKEGQ